MTGMYWHTDAYLENHLAEAKDEKRKTTLRSRKVYAADASGHPDVNATVYDFSYKECGSMLISAILLIIIKEQPRQKNMQKARA